MQVLLMFCLTAFHIVHISVACKSVTCFFINTQYLMSSSQRFRNAATRKHVAVTSQQSFTFPFEGIHPISPSITYHTKSWGMRHFTAITAWLSSTVWSQYTLVKLTLTTEQWIIDVHCHSKSSNFVPIYTKSKTTLPYFESYDGRDPSNFVFITVETFCYFRVKIP